MTNQQHAGGKADRPVRDGELPENCAATVRDRMKTVAEVIKQTSRNATYWGQKHKSGLFVIQAYTLAASLIMAFNLVAKDNVKNVGGWIPFCLAAAALTTVVTFLVNGLKSEDPKGHRDKCLEAVAAFRAMQRELTRKEWTEKKVEGFDRRLAKAERDYSLYLVPPPKLTKEVWWWVVLLLVVGLYLAYEFYQLPRP